MSRERPALFRNKFREQVRFADCHQLLHLFPRNVALQDYFADAESAGLGIGQRALAGKRVLQLINFPFFANRADADRFMPIFVDR